jgi:peroxiredoxin
LRTLVRVLAYAAVVASFGLGVAGWPRAAIAVAAAVWLLGGALLLRPSRHDAGFLDRFVVTLAIIAAGFQLMTAFVGGGSDLSSWVGQPAPDVELITLEGETLRLSDLEGRKVMVDIWATWCPPCRAVIPNLVTLDQSMGDDALTIIGISDEPPGTLAPFVREFDITYPIASASALPAPYGQVTSIPTLFVIDKEGIIQNVVVGYHGLDELTELATQRDWQAVHGD